MDFSIVLTCDKTYGISKSTPDNENAIPWNISREMLFFQTLTLVETDELDKENSVIMGRNTADTLDAPLTRRVNIVITSQSNYRANEGFYSSKTLDQALILIKTMHITRTNKVFVIGSAHLVLEAIKHKRCRTIYLNVIDDDYQCDIKLATEFIDTLNSESYDLDYRTEDAVCTVRQLDQRIKFNKYTYYNPEEFEYLQLLDKILTTGEYRKTRNANTYSIFGEKLVFDMKNGFPLLTSKEMFHRGILEELLFFLRGDTNTKKLEDKKVTIWHSNTTKEFIDSNNKNLQEYDMGPMYGFQWRHFNAPYQGCDYDYSGQGIDQLKQVIDTIVLDPNSRRIEMTTFNPVQVELGVLHPCHGLFTQFYVEHGRISLQMTQRSVDSILGMPFNIASYAALLHIVTNLVNNHAERKHVIDYTPGKLIMVFGDTHIYSDEQADHVELAKQQIKMKFMTYTFPEFHLRVKLKSINDLMTLSVTDINIVNYVSNGPLKAKMVA